MGKIYSNAKESIELPELGIDVIALSMSGGADSSLLTYLVAKNIVETQSYTKILPFTRYRPYPEDAPMSWNVTRSKQIIKKITELLGKDVFLEHYVEYPIVKSRTSLAEEQILVEQLHNKLEMIVEYHEYTSWKYYYGVTSNPSKEEMIAHDFLLEYRMEDRDNKTRKKSSTRPFDLVDKKFIADIYKQENIIDTVFPLTYSCEGGPNLTNNYTNHCGECWWCKERQWAFGRYI